VESLAGEELAAHIPNLNEGVRDVSPSVRLFITQSLLEPLLKSRAEEMGADLRFVTEMISLQQDSEGVRCIPLRMFRQASPTSAAWNICTPLSAPMMFPPLSKT
jgi:hypothetical protein